MATIAWVINAMTSTHHETLYKSISFEANIENRIGKVMVDDVFELNVEPNGCATSGCHYRHYISWLSLHVAAEEAIE